MNTNIRIAFVLAAAAGLSGVGASCGSDCGGWDEDSVDPRLQVFSADREAAVGREGTIALFWGPSPGSYTDLVESGTTEDLLSVSSDGIRTAVGRHGTIRRSEPGNDEVWGTPVVPPVSADLHGVWTGGGLGVVVGALGTILISDASQYETWAATASPTTHDLHAVARVSRTGGVERLTAVGAAGTVIYSDDRGATWALVDVGTQEDLLAIASIGDGFYAVGTGGTVIAGDGESWTRVPLDTTETLHEVRSIPPDPPAAGPNVMVLSETTAYRVGGGNEREFEFEGDLRSVARMSDGSRDVLYFLLDGGRLRTYTRDCETGWY